MKPQVVLMSYFIFAMLILFAALEQAAMTNQAPLSLVEVRYSPDGRFIASSANAGGITLWDSSDCRQIQSLDTARTSYKLAYSPDGLYLASADSDVLVRIWNLQTGAVVQELSSLNYPVSSLVYSPDGRFILTTTSGNALAIIWDVATGHQVQAIDMNLRQADISSIKSAVYSPDGRFIITASSRTIDVWEAATGEHLYQRSRELHHPNHLSFNPTEQAFISSGNRSVGGNILVAWDFHTGEELGTIAASYLFRGEATYSPDGNSFLLHFKTWLELWDSHTFEQRASFAQNNHEIMDVVYSPDGRWIVSVGTGGTIWNAETLEALCHFG